MTTAAPPSSSIAPSFSPLKLGRGPDWPNRLALAPLTNTQSQPDGVLSDDEYRWLTMRAEGGFGLVTTCAAHVQAAGQGFPGQLGVFDDKHIAGLSRLAAGLRRGGAVSAVQLHHGGGRADLRLTGKRVGPSPDPQNGVVALSEQEIGGVIDDFVRAALRSQQAGFDGVQVHGAHGYLLAQFLSPITNQRSDAWGGSLENRSRLTREIVQAIRRACRPNFQVGIRISPERFGLLLPEVRELAAALCQEGAIDYLDLSLWDVRKEPEEAAFKGRPLMSYFTDFERGSVRVGAAGKIMSAQDVTECLEAGADYAILGKAGILVHDFPKRAQRDPKFQAPPLPAPAALLAAQGVGPSFINYLRGFPGLVA